MSTRINEVRRYIQTNFPQRRMVEDLASKSCINASTIISYVPRNYDFKTLRHTNMLSFYDSNNDWMLRKSDIIYYYKSYAIILIILLTPNTCGIFIINDINIIMNMTRS